MFYNELSMSYHPMNGSLGCMNDLKGNEGGRPYPVSQSACY
jgi:hypothetical protein